MKTIGSILLSLFLLSAYSSLGQNSGDADKKQRPTLEKLEEMRLSFVLKRLNLSEDQKSKFEPLYAKYRKEYLLLMNGKGSQHFEHKRPSEEDIQKMTDKEAKALVENDLAKKRKMLDHKEKYFNEFSKIMSHKKVALLFQAEIDFHKKLFKRMRKRGEKRQERKP
jgi:hypothetical protein